MMQAFSSYNGIFRLPKTIVNSATFRQCSIPVHRLASILAGDQQSKDYGSYDSLPGPTIFPLLGNPAHLRHGPKRFHLTSLKMAQLHGEVFRDGVLGVRLLQIHNPVIAEDICRAEGKWPYHDFGPVLEAYFEERTKLGYPTFLGEKRGNEWAEQRSIFNKQLMQPMKIKAFYPVFSDVAQSAVKCIRELRDHQSMISDVKKSLLGKWALESMGMFTFGRRTGLLDGSTREETKRLFDSVDTIFKMSGTLSRVRWMKSFQKSTYKRLRESIIDLYSNGSLHVQEVLDHLKECHQNGKEPDENIANSFVAYLLKNGDQSIDQCTTNVIETYSAGLDTTTATATWLLYWLGKNLDKQEILYEEIQEHIGDNDVVTDDLLQKMPYLRACLKESNRLSPAAAIVIRSLDEDIVVREHVVPAQTVIGLNNYAMGRNENLFPNAESFKPERWLRNTKAVKEIHPFSSIPFGFGHRSCVGRRIAEAEIQILVALVSKNFKFEYRGEEQDGEIEFILTPTNPTSFAFYDRKN